MEDDESSVVVFSCGFEICDDIALEGCGADVDGCIVLKLVDSEKVNKYG